MSSHLQRNLPPMEVQPVNRPAVNSPVNSGSRQSSQVVTGINPLRWVREALQRARLSQTYLAAAMGISEPLLSAQLSEHNQDKHLSLRRLRGVDDASFWREFALLILEDLGLQVVVLDREQAEAHAHLQAAAVSYARTVTR